MNPSTFNNLMNSAESDFNIQDSFTLDDALSMVEFQESLVIDEEEWEELKFEEGV